jgi:uncharacterized protein (DUF488 family)
VGDDTPLAQKAILTIGHSTHEAETFLRLLRDQGAELLVDVRRHPGSRRVPWTRSEALAELMGGACIGYLHLESLGGRRRPAPGSPNAGWRVAQFQGYADHMASEEFLAGLGRLEDEATKRLVALMCAEAQWWRCHRRLLADALTIRGWTVMHLDGRGGRQEHSLTDFGEVRDGELRYPARGDSEPPR